MEQDQTIKTAYDVIVIGGGASGMMAAAVASDAGASVLLLEKNKRLGEKLRITGGGRCNVTNTEEDLRILLKNYGPAEQSLYSAFTKFGVQDTIDYFQSQSIPIKIEDKKRAFPVSEIAGDVAGALIRKLNRNKVTVLTRSPVTKIVAKKGNISSVTSGDHVFTAKTYVLSTGGLSHPKTGSTGDGYGWLAELEHKVNEPSPSITPLALRDAWVSKVAGVTAKDVRISFYKDNVKEFKLEGDILFTHFGISGPLILNNAHKVAELLKTGVVMAKIDCFPGMDQKELDLKIISVLTEHGSKQLKNVLQYFTPPGLTPAIKELQAVHVNFEAKTSEVSKECRSLLVATLKNLPLSVEKLMGLDKAVVADGGIDLSEVDMRTMRSKKIANLFVTGDLLDINRPSGGYSLQLCWTTGTIAGTEAAVQATS